MLGGKNFLLLSIGFFSFIFIIMYGYYLNGAAYFKVIATDSYNTQAGLFGDRRFAHELTENDPRMEHSFEPRTCLSKASLLNQRAGLRPSLDLDTINYTTLMALSRYNTGILGNMFQTASVIGIARWHGYTPILHK